MKKGRKIDESDIRKQHNGKRNATEKKNSQLGQVVKRTDYLTEYPDRQAALLCATVPSVPHQNHGSNVPVSMPVSGFGGVYNGGGEEHHSEVIPENSPTVVGSGNQDGTAEHIIIFGPDGLPRFSDTTASDGCR